MKFKEIIKATDWQKRWVVFRYTLLSSSLMQKGYDEFSRARFGVGLPHNLFISKDNSIVCYQSKDENQKFGRLIDERLMKDSKFTSQLIKELDKKTKVFYKFLKKNKSEKIDYFFDDLRQIYSEYLPIFIAVNRAGNNLKGKNSDKVLSRLKKIRMDTEHIYTDVDNFLKKHLAKIAKREKYNQRELLNLHYKELEEYLNSETLPSKKDLKKRVGLYYFHDSTKWLSGLEINKFEKAVVRSFDLKKGYAKGQSAYPGIVTGKVRIVINPSKVKNFRVGDILVASWTRPEYVWIMKKAGAIVTDGGGVLSHAAIVSREFKKPCIIGTQTATKAFKDGDLVEVDANKGIVRKI